MPELPEVETMVQDLDARVRGRFIEGVEVYWDRMIGYPTSVESFCAAVRGKRIETVRRRGKFALIDLDDGKVLAIHRGMTGSLLLRDQSATPDRFVRARLRLDEGQELRFDDSRKFGRLYVVDAEDSWEPPWSRLGVEPLAEEFIPSLLRSRLRTRKAPIKTVLLNQAVIAGVGNIYADESLWVSRIHPLQPANSLTAAQSKRLRDAVVEVLSTAVARRGTTFSSYRDVDGESGENQTELYVFHRHGQPCFRCHAVIQRIVVAARGTHFCPRCQKVR